ncbi:erythromycin esterase family protein [Streptomyces zagrosensis]|uniref:Erythromycin esterase n=1 Tax=Streptomyces zagrosensis TaxID=1042984 RepID=A0A7W9UXN0_9ACTN|nr:erythromycin esterase family protein [Streptomyces zagrosensis]MBB5934817.1 erythromycin esterase [Streptomyces zagrosensis]
MHAPTSPPSEPVPEPGPGPEPEPDPATTPPAKPPTASVLGSERSGGEDGGAAAATVRHWIAAHAHPLPDLGARAPLNQLAPLRTMIGEARIVGLGEATRGAAELTTLKHQLFRYLVEELGFRSLALDEDWSKGLQYDAYVRGAVVPGYGGDGPVGPRELLADAWKPHRSAEFLAVLHWIRAFNQRHPDDQVRIVGLDYGAVQAHSYDAVTDHVRTSAPKRLPELTDLYAELRPSQSMAEHGRWYVELPDQRPIRDRARQARALVASLPPSDAQALALRHTRVIEGYYAHHASGAPGGALASSDEGAAGGIDGAFSGIDDTPSLMAENAIWWHEHTGHKIAFWSGLGHTANGAPLTVSFPPAPASPATRWNEGGALRRHFGAGYVSAALMFGTGEAIHSIAPPSPELADAVLSAARPDPYLLDLRAPQPVAAHAWFAAPAKVRVIGPLYEAERDADHHIAGGRLTEWFDVVAWVPRVSPLDWLP